MPYFLLLDIYIVVFLVQIILLLLAWKKNNFLLWIGLYVFEIVSVVSALVIMLYYNEHPGYMLSTMGHFLISMAFSGIFLVMLLVTIPVSIIWAFTHWQDKT